MCSIRADYIRIILMEANSAAPLDIKSLELLMHACVLSDLATIEKQAEPKYTTRAAQAARFILRKHQFASRRQESETQHA